MRLAIGQFALTYGEPDLTDATRELVRYANRVTRELIEAETVIDVVEHEHETTKDRLGQLSRMQTCLHEIGDKTAQALTDTHELVMQAQRAAQIVRAYAPVRDITAFACGEEEPESELADDLQARAARVDEYVNDVDWQLEEAWVSVRGGTG